MWKTVAGILLLLLEYWISKAPERKERDNEKEKQDGREDVVNGDVDAVVARIDRLLTKARDRA